MVLAWRGAYYEAGAYNVPEGVDVDVLPEGDRLSHRFYRSGGGSTKLGTLRAAIFGIGALLEVGEEASVSVIGKVAGVEQVVDGDYVRRLSANQIVSTLGSKWGRERVFTGV
jgi:hypothetical protein